MSNIFQEIAKIIVSSSKRASDNQAFPMLSVYTHANLSPGSGLPKSSELFYYVIREVFIKGAHLNQLYWQGLALVIFSGVIFTFAVLRFQQRIK